MIGIIGSGSFGTAIANLIALNQDVLLYTRKESVRNNINENHTNLGVDLLPNICAVNEIKTIAEKCELIFPIVPSANFRSMMKSLSPFLRPYHILIHGTKGFDIKKPDDLPLNKIGIQHIRTMSQVIKEESVVLRIGCLSGPNLAIEIINGQPTATVIGSKFNEVIEAGQQVLTSKKFHVFGTHEIIGAELAGALKNTIAIGSGILSGQGLGKNIQALLLTRGLSEMIQFGKAFGVGPAAFVGTAGIGDLICTATSEKSRNFSLGKRLGLGQNLETITQSMPELAEGLRTLQIARAITKDANLNVPITEMLYRTIFEDFPIKKAIEYLMRYPYHVDVDFIT